MKLSTFCLQTTIVCSLTATTLVAETTGKELALRRATELAADLKVDDEVVAKEAASFHENHGDSAQLYEALADRARQQGRWQEALEHYNTLPRTPALTQKQVFCWAKLGDSDSIIASLGEESDPKPPELQLALADALTHKGTQESLAKACQLYEELTNTSYRLLALQGSARAHAAQGNAEMAYNLCVKLAAEDVQHCSQHMLQAAGYMAQKDPKAAVATLETAETSTLSNSELIYKARLLYSLGAYGQLTGERAAMLTKLEGDKDERELRYLLGCSYAEQGEHKAALALLVPLLREPNDTPANSLEDPARTLLTVTSSSYHSDPASMPRWVKLLERDYPSSAAAARGCHLLGLAYENQGKTDEALTCYDTLIDKYPDYPGLGDVMTRRAKLFANLGDWEACATDAAAALEDWPKGEEVHTARLLLAQSFYHQGQYDKAIAILKSGLDTLRPQERAAAELITALCYRDGLGNPDAFARHAEEALSLAPASPSNTKIHLALFAYYYERAEGGRANPNKQSTERAAQHLYMAWRDGDSDISRNQQLWLASYYSEQPKAANRALEIYREVFNLDKASGTLQLKRNELAVEDDIIRLAQLLHDQGDRDMEYKLLKGLVDLQKSQSDWPWRYCGQASLALAKLLENQGKTDEAANMYEQTLNSPTPLPPAMLTQARLQHVRLQYAELDKELQTSDNRCTQAILRTLRSLQTQRNVDDEPLFLEAALDQAKITAAITPSDEKTSKTLSLLIDMRQSFTTTGDVRSKEYHEKLASSPEKTALFTAYMMLFDAHIARLEADRAHETGAVEEEHYKRQAAQEIYTTLRSEAFAVTDYLSSAVDDALQQLAESEHGNEAAQDNI